MVKVDRDVVAKWVLSFQALPSNRVSLKDGIFLEIYLEAMFMSKASDQMNEMVLFFSLQENSTVSLGQEVLSFQLIRMG